MNVDTEARQILGEAGLPDRGPLLDDAAGYLGRTRRARRYGLIGGLVLGFGPLVGNDQLSLAFPRMLAGYVLGLLVSEWLIPRRPRSAHRAAALRVRRARDLLPVWAQVAVWVVFLPVLASPLLTLVHPVRGLAHISTYGQSCDVYGGLSWPGLPVLTAAAAIGATGLVVAQLTLARLARRPRPADDLDAARLDDVLRGMSARAVAGGAAALALASAATIGLAVSEGAHVSVCSPRSGSLVRAYPWAASLDPWLNLASIGLMTAAFIVLAVCRRRQDPRGRSARGIA